MLFAIKLAAVPALVSIISAVARRLGPRAAGLLIGLPLATGPIVFFLTLSHGTAFGVTLAEGVLRGLVATEAFAVAYALVAHRLEWAPSLALGLTGFAIVGYGVSELPLPHSAELIAIGGLAAVLALGVVRHLAGRMADVPLHPEVRPPSPRGEILIRAGLATAMFAAVTVVSDSAGPTLGGLLAPFPVVTAVMAVFTQRSQGGPDTLSLLAGMVRGTLSFWAFFATLVIALPNFGIGLATLAACAAGVAVGAALAALLRRDSRHRLAETRVSVRDPALADAPGRMPN